MGDGCWMNVGELAQQQLKLSCFLMCPHASAQPTLTLKTPQEPHSGSHIRGSNRIKFSAGYPGNRIHGSCSIHQRLITQDILYHSFHCHYWINHQSSIINHQSSIMLAFVHRTTYLPCFPSCCISPRIGRAGKLANQSCCSWWSCWWLSEDSITQTTTQSKLTPHLISIYIVTRCIHPTLPSILTPPTLPSPTPTLPIAINQTVMGGEGFLGVARAAILMEHLNYI